MATAPLSEYKIEMLKTLQFCYELQDAGKLVSASKKSGDFPAAVEAVLGVPGQSLKPGGLDVIHTCVTENDFTFNSAGGQHPTPDAVKSCPLVVELMTKDGVNDRMFVRVFNNLDYHDGVLGLHGSFQVLEFLEHKDSGKISPYPLTGKNGSEPGAHFGNFISHMTKVMLNRLSMGCCARRASKDANERVTFRFVDVPATTKFKDVLKVIESVRKELDKDYLAVTVNYSPKIALAFVPGMDTLNKSRDEKMKWLTLPPVGAGPPPSMDETLPNIMFNVLFFNNYGKNDPQISAKVTDCLWHWMGMQPNFCPFAWVMQVQGRLMVRLCMPASQWKQVNEAGLLTLLGEGREFKVRPSLF
jgi:hypothetical protein